MPTKLIMPVMGEGVTDATITQWLKQEGDPVDQYEALVEVNTDKVDTEIPSPVSGTLLKIIYPPDTVVAVNQALAWIGEPGEDLPEEDLSAPEPIPEPAAVVPTPAVPPPPTPPTPEPTPVQTSPPMAAPVVRSGPLQAPVSPLAARAAAEHGVDLGRVPGTGYRGRVTKADVLRFVDSGAASFPTPTEPSGFTAPASEPVRRGGFFSPVVARMAAEHGIDLNRVRGTGVDGRITKYDMEDLIQSGGLPAVPALSPQPAGPVISSPDWVPGSTLKHTPVRRSIAKHMVESKRTSPHVTSIMEIDMSAVSAHRATHKAAYAQEGVKLTFTAYFVYAVVRALQTYPVVNSSWSEDGVVLHQAVNIGLAVSLDEAGLIVPVIKNAAGLSMLEIARAVNDLAGRARGKKLTPDEVRGGTFTITNHGTSGSLFATPIINQPQCGILGTGVIQKRALVVDDAIAIRPMVYTGLTFDHRILDGAVADYFLGAIKAALENWK